MPSPAAASAAMHPASGKAAGGNQLTGRWRPTPASSGANAAPAPGALAPPPPPPPKAHSCSPIEEQDGGARRQRRQRLICFNCGGQGHDRAQCTSPAASGGAGAGRGSGQASTDHQPNLAKAQALAGASAAKEAYDFCCVCLAAVKASRNANFCIKYNRADGSQCRGAIMSLAHVR